MSGSVYVSENATLTAPALAEVSSSVDVSENATLTAPALAEVSGYVYVSENATLTAPALRTIGHVAYNTTIFGHEVRVHDGIGAVTVSEKSRDGITIRCCRHAKFEDGGLVGDKMYVASQGEHNAHGDTLEGAMADLAYKTADRDVSAYQNMPMDTAKPPYEWATIYRVITGACQTGTEHFIKQQGELKESYTLSEIIDLTRGAYGSERFREVVA